MLKTLREAWKIAELRSKLIFTVFILLIFRVGTAIPVPYINIAELQLYFQSASNTILGLMNVMSGGAFGSATVLALGIQPYINAQIIIQLLTIAIPALERMARDDGEAGRKKIESITRYTTVGIGLLQGFGYYMLIKNYGMLEDGAGWIQAAVIILTFTAGSAFVMWLGEQITEFGVGNGISIILFAGIIARGPSMVNYMIQGVRYWADGTEDAAYSLAPWSVLLLVLGMLALVIFVVFINASERRLPVQYAKRMVGRKLYGGQSSHIPMKVNMSGVLPIIFAQSVASIPATIIAFVPKWSNTTAAKLFDTTSVFYCVIYFLLILGFAYFYATIQFNPVEVANNLKKNGGFIPGYRPGKPTAEFIAKVLNKITMFGAIFQSVVAILPIVTGNIVGISALAIGGTSVIIVVSVALETVKALEAQMLMRNYKGFLE